MTKLATVATLFDERLSSLEPTQDGDGIRLAFQAKAGLYQLSVMIDGQDFDWESLYEDLYNYGNSGQRTGPWDFKLGSAKALVPSYWVRVDGERIGLWYFQRVSLEDIEARRFRGRMAFHLSADGDHLVELEPYNYPGAIWLDARLERDPVDHLEPVPEGLQPAAGNMPESKWNDDAYWDRKRRELDGDLRLYAGAMTAAMDWAMQREEATDGRAVAALDIPILYADWRLRGNQDALRRAISLLDDVVARENWGNQAPDGYGHNGDMGAALLFDVVSWAWHAMAGDMGKERHAAVRDKLLLQGKRFFALALLNRDYWGGSVLQDHGWRSMWLFGTVALRLHGVLPEAETWLRYILPRLQQCLRAMPRDGVIPRSSHVSIYLYMEEASVFRQTFLALGGHDIYDDAPVARIIDFVWDVMRRSDRECLTSFNLGLFSLNGGVTFFNQIAAKYGDARAARIHALLLDRSYESHHMQTQGTIYHHTRFRAFFAHARTPKLLAPPAPPDRRLMHYEDSALVLFRDDQLDVSLKIQCGPWCGYTAYRRAPGPCDRMTMAPTAGDFLLLINGMPLVAAADSGYRLQTAAGSVMLIDDQGQIGDIGYPMSIPSYPDHGEEIRKVEWDAAAGTGFVRLDLAPAYPGSLDLISYFRDFHILTGCHLLVRDTVLLREPHRLTWLFHADQTYGVSVQGLTGHIAGPPPLKVQPVTMDAELTATVSKIDQVYSYSSSRPISNHLRYATVAPVTRVCVDFHITAFTDGQG